jgi:hypothetical protein
VWRRRRKKRDTLIHRFSVDDGQIRQPQVRWSAIVSPRNNTRCALCEVGKLRSTERGDNIDAGMTVQKQVSCVCLLPKRERAPALLCPFSVANTVRSLQCPAKSDLHVCPVACASACYCPSAAFTAHHSSHHCLAHIREAIVCAHVVFSC